MADLKLVYIDKEKNEKTVLMKETVFTIGRSPENDLAISDSRLSREHLKIERFGEVYIAKDVGSSNGTLYNGEPLQDPVAVEHEDKFDLGGGLLLTALLKDDKVEADPEPAAAPEAPKPAAAPAPSSSISPMIFLLVPAVGIVLLLAVGGIYLLLRDTGGTVIASGDDSNYSDSSDSGDTSDKTPTPKKENSGSEVSATPATGPSVSGSPATTDQIPGGTTTNDAGSSVEQSGAAFLRLVAQNEPRAFLTGEQSDIVAKKIKQLSGSAALADNINSAKKNSAKLKEIAAANNLKPQLIATAAITKLGDQRGDVVQTAQAMADVLEVLSTQVGNEFGDDVLMMIAAYDQGAAGDTMKLRNKLQTLTTKFPQSSRTIRSIWFLKKNDQITDQEYDFALRFLAIGTITQNPKGFNVKAEPLIL